LPQPRQPGGGLCLMCFAAYYGDVVLVTARNTHDAGNAHPCDGRVKAIEELTKSAENKANNSVRLGCIPCPEL
jgi:hypothetical protein